MPTAVTTLPHTIAIKATQPPTVRGKRIPPRIEEEVRCDTDTRITLRVFCSKSMQRNVPPTF